MLERHIIEELDSCLKIFPVTLLAGPRQSGKTTLVESVAKKQNYAFFTFDDALSLSNARRDPMGWIMSLPKPVIIDEVQRLPEFFLPIKRDVDQHRIPGRYLLTGSANPLLLPSLADSLAGRIGIINLWPFSQGELRKNKERYIPNLFASELTMQKFTPMSKEEIYQMLLRGGFPPVQHLQELKDVSRWIQSYLQTMMERDVRDISNVENLREFPHLFRLLATRASMLLNIADLSRSLGMVNMTVKRYLRLLEVLYFIHLLPAWYSNLGKRLIKAPKLHTCDTAILCQLLEIDQKRLQNDPNLFGKLLENFVFCELMKQKSWLDFSIQLYHFRDGDYEVDFVLEKTDGTIVGLEVKSSKLIQTKDLRGLKHLKSIAKNRFKRGIILHLGEHMEYLEENLWAMPLQALWS